MPEIKQEEIKPGMYLRIFQKIQEKDKIKLQQIEGLVLSRKHKNEIGATFTLRRVIDGVGVEWIMPVFSPLIQKIELLKSSRVRRAKLYYLRNKSPKQTRKKLKIAAKETKITDIDAKEAPQEFDIEEGPTDKK